LIVSDCSLNWLFVDVYAGPLPATWADDAVPALATLDLSQNTLTGPLPDSWSRLAQLQHVNLSYNDFGGQLPETWSAMTNLTTL
jgi:hypothetical protein